jgi:excisionase family DNA binding protein
MVTAIDSPVLSRPDAAVYLGVKVQTLAVWASTGRYRLPFVRVGRRVVYKRADLDRFLAENTVEQADVNS